jgi:hypothetical protein
MMQKGKKQENRAGKEKREENRKQAITQIQT